ncbi:hypothetical protein ACN28C_25575 [Plantactinospora sp. WMMC1484]|uniref:hypothetical protein n=1 Tax=Plantactinospora sp. WMMC1484 TaxID=3404122 RepID=UPI003BF4B4C6
MAHRSTVLLDTGIGNDIDDAVCLAYLSRGSGRFGPLRGKNRTSWNLLMAGSVVATLPTIMTFLVFPRRFIQGISMTGLKG